MWAVRKERWEVGEKMWPVERESGCKKGELAGEKFTVTLNCFSLYVFVLSMDDEV